MRSGQKRDPSRQTGLGRHLVHCDNGRGQAQGFPMRQRNRPTLTLVNDSPSTPRAVLYLRVSTGRQAEHDLSIPDQRSQLQSWCSRQGYQIVAEFVEAGVSAVDDRRPVFQQMIERACDGDLTPFA